MIPELPHDSESQRAPPVLLTREERNAQKREQRNRHFKDIQMTDVMEAGSIAGNEASQTKYGRLTKSYQKASKVRDERTSQIPMLSQLAEENKDH